MPTEDQGAGRAFVWTISSFLFICVAGGGACLITYMTSPDPDSSAWLAVTGFALVCLPWAFWLFTFAYRVLSRACGFRMVIGGLGAAASANAAAAEASSTASNDTKRAQIEAVEDHHGKGKHKAETQRNLSSRSSVASHESEMPLASIRQAM